jgi:spore coat polysaccharide biosynthesis protein SpsF
MSSRGSGLEALRTGIIVQMRLESSRLPRKALLPFGSTTIAGAVLRRLRRIPADAYILATDVTGAAAFGRLAQAHQFSVFAGPSDDVLARYIMALEAFGLDRVIRATGDNPFVSPSLAVALVDQVDELEKAQHITIDYAGYLGMPLGMGVELVRSTALRNAGSDSSDAFEHEHVCPFLYRHPERFRIMQPQCPQSYYMPTGRVTIDTQEDYQWSLKMLADVGEDPEDARLLRRLGELAPAQ